MSDEEKSAGKGFTVQDRRRFSPETGEAREEAPDSQTSTGEAESRAEAHGQEQTRQQDVPEINFSTFVIGLSTQALMHLGEIASPLTGQVEKDVPVAKQMIDILGMLQEKTRGNLNQGEDRLLQDILYDLRMKYVEAVKKN